MSETTLSLHSKYQPQLEAERYINALNPDPNMDWYILMEPGQGYLIPALLARCPGCNIIALHADTVFRETESRYPDARMWFPDSGCGVQEFLETQIPEGEAARIIEWRPALGIYGGAYMQLLRECANFIKRAEASRRTSAAFGRRWARNFFRNLALLERTLLYTPLDMPIVITGSGPALEAALPEIYAAREGVFVLAASSSLPALASGGIVPDMVMSTDGGGWALLHLYTCFRFQKDDAPRRNPLFFLACPLSAALPSQCAALPVLPMNDGSLWQSMALHSVGVPSALVAQRGTVTASALELALIVGTGDIFLAGMDLAVRDIQSHARPYGFDHLWYGRASRLRPVYSQMFARSGDMKAGGSHDVYAAWFKNRITTLRQRVFSLGANNAVFEHYVNEKIVNQKFNGIAQKHFKTITLNGSGRERCNHAAQTIINALDDQKYAAGLTAELAPLLFPSQPDVPPGEIADAIRGIV